MIKIKIKLEKFESIPYGRQDITEADIESVIKVLRSNFITQGPVIPIFEQKLCDYTGAKYSVVVNSCTSALHIACLALDLGPGDILWTSPITFVASANCALYCGATIDFVDIDQDTALMSVERLRDKLEYAEKEGNLPKIIIPVHFAGQPCDMAEIYTLGKKYGFKIIEDAAHAIGAKYQDELVGNCRYSDITVFSFHPVKIITTGEGGAALTNNSKLAERMELLRSHGVTRDPNKMKNHSSPSWYYEQIELGLNYRMTDIHAALGNSQMDRLDEYILQRSKIALWYDEKFKDIDVNPLVQKLNRSSSYHLYVVMFKNGPQERNKVYANLRECGIEVNLHYMPVYRHPYYELKKIKNFFPAAEHYFNNTITLPIFPGLIQSELDYISSKLHFHLKDKNI